jgi:hypothetical protein
MIPASFRPLRIDGTAPGRAVEKDAVATGHPGKSKGLGFRVKMLDQMVFHQSSGNMLEIII